MRYLLLNICLAVCSLNTLQAHVHDRSFAIVVDEKSSAEASAELKSYAHAIEDVQGLKVHTIIDRWGVPDSIRSVLYHLYKDKESPLCGAVFVGEIPVPMVRDAQHMTSAFKMDQKYDRNQSSVPSDRYYDDFDLKFNYLGHDEGTLFHYYSLRHDSPQLLQSDIFTGRIRPTDGDGISRYEKLRAYLKKAAKAKYEDNVLDNMFYFTGHGSLNESKVAAMDERISYYEHFPWLLAQKQGISYMDYSQAPFINEMLIDELMRPELDFAMLHHHGTEETQYLNSYAHPENIEDGINYLKRQLRQMIRRRVMFKEQNRDSLITAVAAKYNIPEEWITDTFSDESIERDSAEEARLNLTVSDFKKFGFVPSCRMVVFDACYNASFHREKSVASEYIFSPGRTLAAIGGTVNLLQDKWYDRMAGLMGAGMYAGYLNLFQNYLESHLIGDPTFVFTPSAKADDVNAAIASVLSGRNKKVSLKDDGLPDIEVLRMELLYRQGRVGTSELLDKVRNSRYSQVRLEALYLLSLSRGEDFVKALTTAVDDRTEMVQRFAVNYLRFCGDERLAAPLMKLFAQNNLSQRVEFNVMQAMMYFPKDLLLAEFEKQSAVMVYHDRDKVRDEKRKIIEREAEKWADEVEDLFKKDLSDRNFSFIASCMRLYCPHRKVERVLQYILECGNADRQVQLLEALGWMRMSYKSGIIAETSLKISRDMKFAEEVRNEALKTYNRVK